MRAQTVGELQTRHLAAAVATGPRTRRATRDTRRTRTRRRRHALRATARATTEEGTPSAARSVLTTRMLERRRYSDRGLERGRALAARPHRCVAACDGAAEPPLLGRACGSAGVGDGLALGEEAAVPCAAARGRITPLLSASWEEQRKSTRERKRGERYKKGVGVGNN